MAGRRSGFWDANQSRFIKEVRTRLVNGEMPRGGWEEVGKALGITKTQARMQWRFVEDRGEADEPGPATMPAEVAEPDPPDPIEVERERIERVRKLHEEQTLIRDIAGERSLRAYLDQLVRATAQNFDTPPPYTARQKKAGATEETMLQMFSDWHSYEEISREGTRGFNEYNAAVMAQRVRRLVETHIDIKDRLEAGGGWNFRKLVIASNGDYVPGTIHELERHSDAPNTAMAVYGTGLILAQALRDLAGQYEEIEIFCTSGNHGRWPDAKRMQQKDPLRNWDTLVTLFAREHLRSVPNIKWYIPDAYSVGFQVYRWSFLQTHGHDIKSWGGIPFYGIQRFASNINALEASRAGMINYFLVSHFHQFSSLSIAAGELFVNGSVCGGTEYTINSMGKSDRPSQMMAGIHPDHGVTHRWPIYCSTGPDAPSYDARPWVGVVGGVPANVEVMAG
jgi:hypothetical protein